MLEALEFKLYLVNNKEFVVKCFECKNDISIRRGNLIGVYNQEAPD